MMLNKFLSLLWWNDSETLPKNGKRCVVIWNGYKEDHGKNYIDCGSFCKDTGLWSLAGHSIPNWCIVAWAYADFSDVITRGTEKYDD